MNRPVTIQDRYQSIQELERHERDELDYRRSVIERSSRIAVAAPHGGGIEPGTTEVAAALAGRRFSLYLFEGLKKQNSQDLHITSCRFDDPLLLGLLQRAHILVTVHGCQGSHPFIHIGGLHLPLKKQIRAALRSAGFSALFDHTHHPGVEPGNICNRGILGKGLQLELSEGLRRTLFAGLCKPERQRTTALFNPFITAIRNPLIHYIEENVL